MKNRNGIWSNHFFHPVVSIKKQHCTHYKQEKKTWTGLVGCNKKTSQLSLWVPQLLWNFFGVVLVKSIYRKSLVRGFSLSCV